MGMEVRFTPETEKKLAELATASGLSAEALLEEALSGYADELAETRQMLDSRYDDLKSGRVEPIDGEAFFESLRQREDALLNAPVS